MRTKKVNIDLKVDMILLGQGHGPHVVPPPIQPKFWDTAIDGDYSSGKCDQFSDLNIHLMDQGPKRLPILSYLMNWIVDVIRLVCYLDNATADLTAMSVAVCPRQVALGGHSGIIQYVFVPNLARSRFDRSISLHDRLSTQK